MKIKRLTPKPVAKQNLPRCEAERVTVYYRDNKDTDRRCTRSATVEVNRKHYCKTHAASIALEISLTENN